VPTDQIALGLVWYVAFLLSLTAHEGAHAWAALRLGDPTAYQGGQVTLNPWPHVRRSPFGTVLVPILSFAFQGWMIGWASAPYDPVWAERHPKKEALMAAAGPAANLLLVALAGVALRLGLATGVFALPTGRLALDALVAPAVPWASALAPLVSILFSLNLILFVFNLFPLPPLDGSAVYPPLISEEAARKFKRLLAAQPALSLLGLVVAWRLFGPVFQPVFVAALAVLFAGL
jgi:Zn-dependent protease